MCVGVPVDVSWGGGDCGSCRAGLRLAGAPEAKDAQLVRPRELAPQHAEAGLVRALAGRLPPRGRAHGAVPPRVGHALQVALGAPARPVRTRRLAHPLWPEVGVQRGCVRPKAADQRAVAARRRRLAALTRGADGQRGGVAADGAVIGPVLVVPLRRLAGPHLALGAGRTRAEQRRPQVVVRSAALRWAAARTRGQGSVQTALDALQGLGLALDSEEAAGGGRRVRECEHSRTVCMARTI